MPKRAPKHRYLLSYPAGNLYTLGVRNKQFSFTDLFMELSTEKKKPSYSMHTVAVQIYDCINNRDEKLWNMLEVQKWVTSYFVED